MIICFECNNTVDNIICNGVSICSKCGGVCEEITTQQDLANKTGLKQPHIGGYLRDMDNCDVLRKPIKKILEAQGKWEEFKRMWDKLI